MCIQFIHVRTGNERSTDNIPVALIITDTDTDSDNIFNISTTRIALNVGLPDILSVKLNKTTDALVFSGSFILARFPLPE